MIIVRNGQSILLTQEEMLAAYYEMESMFDMEDVANYASQHINGGKELAEFLANIERMKRIAQTYRDYMEDNSNWQDNMCLAFDEWYTD